MKKSFTLIELLVVIAIIRLSCVKAGPTGKKQSGRAG